MSKYDPEEGKFIDGQKEISTLAAEIIEEYEEAGHLGFAKIRYLFSNEPMLKGDKKILGKASKFGEKDKHLHDYQFLIVLDHQFWQYTPEAKKPLLFHELLHCQFDDESGKPKIAEHDIEEFGAVVKHFGYWESDVQVFSKQLELFQHAEAVGT